MNHGAADLPVPLYSVKISGHSFRDWRSKLRDDFIRDRTLHTRFKDELLLKQRGLGAYDLRSISGRAHSHDAPELDHVFECQLMADCVLRVDSLCHVLKQADFSETFLKQPPVVQRAFQHAHDVHNNQRFLVVCGSSENKKKEGAFRSSLNILGEGRKLERGIEDSLRCSFSSGKNPFQADVAHTMARSVVTYLRDFEDPLTAALRNVPRPKGGDVTQGGAMKERYDGLADEIVQLYDRLHIERGV